jgi:zinc and cadmium transporter
VEFINSIIATFLVSLISFVGVVVLLKQIASRSFIITALISFAAGSLIGDVFLHLLSEHIEEFGYEDKTVIGIFVGILIMLITEAWLHCSHDSVDELEHNHKENQVLAKLNIIGDGVHNFLDGVAIAASFLISPEVGVATTIAIILHEIPQEFADASILLYSGWARKRVLFMNFLTALSAVAGAIFVFIASSVIENLEQILVPVAAGQFIYIALADLMPEIHKKAGVKKYIVEIFMFVLGIFIMYSLTLFE